MKLLGQVEPVFVNKLFKDLNGFDESFFMHFEEIDFVLD